MKPANVCAVTIVTMLSGVVGPAAAEPAADEVVEWADSEANTDYQPKSDSEGSTWKFNPTKLSLNQGASSSGTNFKGARILSGYDDVDVE